MYAEEKTASGVGEETGLGEDQLVNIPPDLIESLRRAVVLLDEELCLDAVGMISDHDHEVGTRLRSMVDKHEYQPMLAALDSATGGD